MDLNISTEPIYAPKQVLNDSTETSDVSDVSDVSVQVSTYFLNISTEVSGIWTQVSHVSTQIWNVSIQFFNSINPYQDFKLHLSMCLLKLNLSFENTRHDLNCDINCFSNHTLYCKYLGLRK